MYFKVWQFQVEEFLASSKQPSFSGSRDGSMGLWEVSEEVLSRAERRQEAEGIPGYVHICHRALEDIPKEYTNPYNCKVRALAFNSNRKVRVHCGTRIFVNQNSHYS